MDIKTSTKTLKTIYGDEEKLYIVPEYQRDYSWKVEHVEELWDDIWKSWYSGKSDYFMGPIVLCKGGVTREYEVVDGQQRLATFAILCSVISGVCNDFLKDQSDSFYSNITDLDKSKANAKRASSIAESCLYDAVDETFFLKLNNKDDTTFKKILKKENLLTSGDDFKFNKGKPRLVKAQKTFLKKVNDAFFVESRKDPFTPLKEFTRYIAKRLMFITMIVDDGYDAYLLFESLNSKGLDLSVSDLLKNKLLSLCENKEKKETVFSYWEKMMQNLDSSRISNSVEFVRIYWCAFHTNTTKKNLYNEIKREINSSTASISFAGQLEEVSEYFSDITNENNMFPAVVSGAAGAQYFSEINRLKYTIAYPLIVYANKVDCPYIDKLAERILNYLFRVISIGGFSVKKASDKVFKALDLFKKGNASEKSVLGLFYDPLYDDLQFKEAFATKLFTDNNFARYVLKKIYMHQNIDETIPNKKAINLEHILPQEDSKWLGFDDLGAGIDNWKYNIGNLTLINENSNKSAYNKPFNEKVNLYRDLDDEGGTTFEMTSELHKEYMKSPYDWDVDRIKKRAAAFADIAVDVWPLPPIK